MADYKLGDNLEWRCGEQWIAVKFVRPIPIPIVAEHVSGSSPSVEDGRPAVLVLLSDGVEFTAFLDDLRLSAKD